MGDAVSLGFDKEKEIHFDTVLTEGDFQKILLSQPEELGDDGYISWVILLGQCVSGTFAIVEA